MINIHTLRIVTGQFTEVLFKGKPPPPPKTKQKQTNIVVADFDDKTFNFRSRYVPTIYKKKPPITLTSTMVIDKNLNILNKFKKIYFFAQKGTNRKIQRQS